MAKLERCYCYICRKQRDFKLVSTRALRGKDEGLYAHTFKCEHCRNIIWDITRNKHR